MEVDFYTSKRKGTFQGFTIEPIELVEPDGMVVIQSMKLIAVLLFQIESLDDVTSLFKRLGVESTE